MAASAARVAGRRWWSRAAGCAFQAARGLRKGALALVFAAPACAQISAAASFADSRPTGAATEARRKKEVIFEACVDSVESGVEAEKGGAKRLELCANLVEGGVTPSPGMLTVLREAVRIPIHVLIRPRGGDFLYSDTEMEVMRRDIEIFKQLGADGVVIGALTPYGEVDEYRCQELIREARPMSVTFHRCFDVARDPDEALESCIRIGVDRILTSGQKSSAGDPESKDLIRSLTRKAKGRIGIIAGGGVTKENIAAIVKETGIVEAHGTAGRISVQSSMIHRPEPPLHMGGEKRNTIDSEFITKRICAKNVKSYVAAMEASVTTCEDTRQD